jgi:uncharacterized protein (DUF58 family)
MAMDQHTPARLSSPGYPLLNTPQKQALLVEEMSVERALSPGWAYASVALLALALLLRQPYLILVGLSLTLLLLIVALWRRHGLTNLTYQRTIEPAAAFHGEEVSLLVRIANGKPLPLPWLTLEEELPVALPVVGTPTNLSHVFRRVLLTGSLELAPYHAVTRRYRLRCAARGYHQIGPTSLRTGDPFGLLIHRVTLRPRDYLIVYPRIVELEALGLAATSPLGEFRTTYLIHEDPARLSGIRDYVAGDSPRRMHWKATARLGSLQVKTFEPSATLDVMIALDVQTAASGSWAYDDDLLELGICTAASLAYAFLEERRPVGLLSNGFPVGQAEEVRILPGRSPQQLTALLDALARLGPWSRGTLADFLYAGLATLPVGATLAVVTAILSPALAEALLAYRGAGYAVSLLLLGEAPTRGLPPTLPGIPIAYLGGAARWQELCAAGPVRARPGPAEEHRR